MELTLNIIQWVVVVVLSPIMAWLAIQTAKVVLRVALILIKALFELVSLAFDTIIENLNSGIRSLQ